jgi:hypothetical protein
VSSDWDSDDIARLIALESAFGTLALMWAGMYAHHANSKPSAAIKQLRAAMLGSFADTKEYSGDIGQRIKGHQAKLLDHVERMAQHADEGYQ